MRILSLIGLVFLFGCSVSGENIKNFSKYCADKGGIYSIAASSSENLDQVWCRDGSNINAHHASIVSVE